MGIFDRINKWFDGGLPTPTVEIIATKSAFAYIPPPISSPPQMIDRAILALDLQVEIAADDIRSKRTTAETAASVIFARMTDEVRRLLPDVTQSLILECITAELAVPADARRNAES